MSIVTIVDVAQRAGVSIATVSRTLNNSGLVSEQKRTRVLEVVRELGYQPGVREIKPNNQIVFLISSVMYMEMVEDVITGILQALSNDSNGNMGKQEPNLSLAISYAGQNVNGYHGALKLLKAIPQDMVYGLIFFHNMCDDAALWNEFQQYPIVQIGEYLDMNPPMVITSDDTNAMYELTNLLIHKGKKHLIFVSGQQSGYCVRRKTGFRHALEDAGISFSEDMVLYTDTTLEGGSDAGKRIAEMENRPDAILCVNDVIACGCLAELQFCGIRVPADMAVTGFDDINLSEIYHPHLTTVRQSFGEMGSEAISMLKALISGKLKMGRITFIQHSIIERETI
jgi:DNA-binding LacI/PurR family transcriptional regulator